MTDKLIVFLIIGLSFGCESICSCYYCFCLFLLLGPLHGLANQEVLVWLTNVIEKVGPDATQDQLKDFLWETLKSGQVRVR